MIDIVFTGRADIRELTAEDLKTVGVSTTKDYVFEYGVPQQVSNEVGEALLSKIDIFGNFIKAEGAEAIVEQVREESGETPPELRDVEVTDEPTPKATTKKSTGSAATSTDSTTSTSTTGNGSSTS